MMIYNLDKNQRERKINSSKSKKQNLKQLRPTEMISICFLLKNSSGKVKK
jgi:hypothetical protein